MQAEGDAHGDGITYEQMQVYFLVFSFLMCSHAATQVL